MPSDVPNPPAFPNSTKTIHLADKDIIIQEGMTLRDYFANSVLMGSISQSPSGLFSSIKSTAEVLAKGNGSDETFQGLAEFCYKTADAMLKERTKP